MGSARVENGGREKDHSVASETKPEKQPPVRRPPPPGLRRVVNPIAVPPEVRRILSHLGLPPDAPPLARARDPTDDLEDAEPSGQLGLGFA